MLGRGLVLKLRVIIAVGALLVGSCTGPGLEPPFSGEAARVEPNDARGTTSQGASLDAGSSWEADGETDADAGSDHD